MTMGIGTELVLKYSCPAASMVFKYTRSALQFCRVLHPYSTTSGHVNFLICSELIHYKFLRSFANMAATQFTVEHDQSAKEFFIQLDKSAKAYLQYEPLENGTVDLYHTLVPTSHRGQGIAKYLAKAALDHFANDGTKFKLTCTYLQKYAKDNPNELYDKMIIS